MLVTIPSFFEHFGSVLVAFVVSCVAFPGEIYDAAEPEGHASIRFLPLSTRRLQHVFAHTLDNRRDQALRQRDIAAFLFLGTTRGLWSTDGWPRGIFSASVSGRPWLRSSVPTV